MVSEPVLFTAEPGQAPERRDAAGRKPVVCPVCHGRGLAVERVELVDRRMFWLAAERRLRPCEVCRGSGVVAWVRAVEEAP